MVNGIITESDGADDIIMRGDILEAMEKLREFLFAGVYNHRTAKAEEKKAEFMLEQMYGYFVKNYTLLLPEYGTIINNAGVERAVCDYIAGMTDRYSISEYCKIFVPKTWKEE